MIFIFGVAADQQNLSQFWIFHHTQEGAENSTELNFQHVQTVTDYMIAIFILPHYPNLSICTHWRPLCCRVWGSGGSAPWGPERSPSSGWGACRWVKAYWAACPRAAREDLWGMVEESSVEALEVAAAWILMTLCGCCGRTSPAGNVWVMTGEEMRSLAFWLTLKAAGKTSAFFYNQNCYLIFSASV